MCTHIINGLPGEDYEMMMETAREVAQMDVQGIKIHLLHLLKGHQWLNSMKKECSSLCRKRIIPS